MEMNKLTKTEVRVLLLALILHQERLTTYMKASKDQNFIENNSQQITQILLQVQERTIAELYALKGALDAEQFIRLIENLDINVHTLDVELLQSYCMYVGYCLHTIYHLISLRILLSARFRTVPSFNNCIKSEISCLS